jgi:Zn-dependent M28 family amino/carboxypeptidase
VLADGASRGAWSRTLVVACWDDEESGLRGSRAWAARARERGIDVTIAFNFDSIGFATKEPGTQRVPTGFSLLFADELDRLAARGHRGDFVAVIGDAAAIPFTDAFVRQAQRDALPHSLLEVPDGLLALPISMDLRRSDHASFWAAGVPALMLTDTAEFRTDTYHCRGAPDVVETLDLQFTTKIVRSAAAALAVALAPSPAPPQAPAPVPSE